MLKSVISLSFVLLLATGFVACKEDNTEILREAKQVATEFHSATMKYDVEKMSDFVDFPFQLDKKTVVKDRDSFKRIVKKKISSMQKMMKAARKTEAVTYEDFINGHEIRAKKFEGDEAIRQAKKLNFKEGDVLVRCYAESDDGAQDGRDYYIVLHPNDLGDLRIHTYFD